MSQHIHFIAIGGAAMHNMALALHKKGYRITGSDDEINEPSYSRLNKAGLLPEEMGWFPEKINSEIDAVILGMHARADNPELLKAQQIGLEIFSYPEYIYEQSKNKLRAVIGGSHGKTTITGMILHVLKYHNMHFDFMVGSQLEGFDTMVQLTDDAEFIVVEGDEYLSSPIDRRPKFHLYKADIGLISGIAWDHINVFPTFEMYVEQFRIFADNIPASGKLIYCQNDSILKEVCVKSTTSAEKISYTIPPHKIENGKTFLTEVNGSEPIELQIFGEHNLMNLEGARLVCNAIGVADENFFEAIKSFKGAARRLETVMITDDFILFKDFAHSPSKLKATADAVKKQFAGRKVIACMELHTFSSLNENFLSEYKGSMDLPDEAFVYFNPHTIEHKKLKPISTEQVKAAFGRNDLQVFTDSSELIKTLLNKNYKNSVLLMMTSGNFDGIDFSDLGKKITG